MPIFMYELRQVRVLVIAWAATCAALLFAMYPGFVGIVIDQDGAPKTSVLESVDTNSFLQAVEVSAAFLSMPIGMYGLLTGWFFGLAFAVVATHLGPSIHTKEYLFKSADFLLTKPFSRSQVFTSKLLAAITSVLVIGAACWLASLAAMTIFAPGFDFTLFLLLSWAPS